MALSKIQGAQIETPVDISAVNVTGVATFASAIITGDSTSVTITVDSDTSNFASYILSENLATKWEFLSDNGNDNALRVYNQSSTQVLTIEQAGYVGINTFAPDSPLTISGSETNAINIMQDTGDLLIRFNDRGTGSAYVGVPDNSSGAFVVQTGGSESIRIDSSGNLGISSTSPDVDGTGIDITGNSSNASLTLKRSNDAYAGKYQIIGGAGGGVAKLRILADGNPKITIGVASTNPVVIGDDDIAYYNVQSDLFVITQQGGAHALSDTHRANICCINQDNQGQPSFRMIRANAGANNGDWVFTHSSQHLVFGTNRITNSLSSPSWDLHFWMQKEGHFRPGTDNSADLGIAAYRWDDVYATNGSIVTSDRNQKNNILDSDLGLSFINKLSPKSYILNGGQRTHYGLISQEVNDVLISIGKTSGDFAGYVSSDLTDEDGNPTGETRYFLRYTEFISPMIQAIKELSGKLDEVVTRIENLESSNVGIAST